MTRGFTSKLLLPVTSTAWKIELWTEIRNIY